MRGTQVRQGERQSVGGVAARRHFQGQERGNHPGDLILRRLTAPRNGAFDLSRGIFGYLDAMSCQSRENHAPRVAELGGRGGIPEEKQRFHRPDVGPVLGNERLEALIDPVKPLG